MAENGVSTTNLSTVSTADSLIANKDGTTARISAPDLAAQLIADAVITAALAGKAPVAVTEDHEARIATAETDIETLQADYSTESARIDTLETATAYASLLYETWAELEARTGDGDGQRAAVIDGDGGNHPDATATGYDGATVDNPGEYRWDAAWSRWVRLGDTVLSSRAPIDSPALTGDATAENLDITGGSLNVGGTVAVTRGGSRVAIIDERGFTQGLLTDANLFVEVAQDGLWARDSAGFLVRLDGDSTVSDTAASEAIVSSGAGMWLARALLGSVAAGASATAKIVLLGDSWIERAPIPQAMADMLYAGYSQGADGYIQPDSTASDRIPLNGATVAQSGWTKYDASNGTAVESDPYGLSGGYFEATGTSATWSASDVTAETIHIYYQDDDGTFRYRVDAGTWVDVVGGDTGVPASVTISGLSTGTTHDLEIDLTGNAGTVRFSGIYCTGIDGVEVSRAGNGGSTSEHWADFVGGDMVNYLLDDIAPHSAFVVLGTNDISENVTPANFLAGLTAITDAVHASAASCSIMQHHRDRRP